MPNGATARLPTALARLPSTDRRMRTPHPIILCADDFALSEGVSRGIVELLQRGRLSAVSCMTASPLWPDHAHRLGRLAAAADIGLHLTLTDLRPLTRSLRLAPSRRLPPLGRLLRSALSRRLDPEEIRREVRAQLDAFMTVRGTPPDFVDGHKHVHLLPQVRGAVVEVVADVCGRGRTYLRDGWEPPTAIVARGVAIPKALAIALLAFGFGTRARRAGIPTNDSFRGVADFRPDSEAARHRFRRFLRGGGRIPLIMCHPGHVDARLREVDPVTELRQMEFDYFASQVFLEDLAEAGCRLARFAEAAPLANRHASAARAPRSEDIL
jgi:predicted glycoside hydrolase/deacetylase ChbG (UPF0249 family)